MAMKTITVLFSVLAIWVVGNVESATAPAPAVDCSSLIVNLADCLSYVTSGSTVNKPEGNCCSGLKTVLKSDAECLCEGFKSSAQLGVTLNMTKAVALPSACHVTAPSLSNCGLSLAAPPAISPEAGSPTSAAGPNENPSAPAPGSSGSVALTTSVGSLGLALAVAASFFFHLRG